MNDHDDIRAGVTAAYTKSIQSRIGCGCPPSGLQANRLADYRPEDLAAVPRQAAGSSLGCGNPVAFAGVRAGQTVLDLGSGAGLDLLLAAQRVGPEGRVIGVDMTPAMIEASRQNITAAGLENVEIRHGLIEELPVADASVDWVISNCVINLSPEKDRVFAEIARVLRPGGRMRISDIVVEDLPGWLRRSEVLYNSCVAGALGEKEYLAGLEQAGLVEVVVQERLVYEVSQLVELIGTQIEGLGGSEMQAGLAVEPGTCCGGRPLELTGGTADPDSIRQLVASVTGKIWSAVIGARRP